MSKRPAVQQRLRDGAIALLIGMIGHLLTPGLAAASDAIFQDAARMGPGINILGYDGIWEGAEGAPFRTENYKMIRAAGFRHVRINFFGFQHMDAANRLDEAVLLRLDRVIEQVVAADLVPVLDQHDSDLCQQTPASCAAKLTAFWTQIAARYAGQHPSLIFEIMNEPGGQMTAAAWNTLAADVLKIIRASHPDRPVIVAAINIVGVPIDELQLPPDDRRLIVTVHYYEPFHFTHQGAPWSEELSRIGPLSWGNAEDRAKVTSDFEQIARWARKHNRPIYLGEFGVYERAPRVSRLRYISFLARSAESFGWSWAYWQFDHDFAAFDTERQRWNPDILDALFGLDVRAPR